MEYEKEDNPTPKLPSDTQHPITFIKTRRMKKAKAAASKEEDLKMDLDNVNMGTKVDDSNGFWIGSDFQRHNWQNLLTDSDIFWHEDYRDDSSCHVM